MNKARRELIANVMAKVDTLLEEIECLKETITDITAEEQEYMDNIPENLQGSSAYEKSESAIECLETAVGCMEDVVDNLTSVSESLEASKE